MTNPSADITNPFALAEAASNGLTELLNREMAQRGLTPLVWRILDAHGGVFSKIAGRAGFVNGGQKARQVVAAYAAAFEGTPPREAVNPAKPRSTAIEVSTTFTLGPV